MGKTGKWLRSILTGKKDNNKEKERSYQHNDNVDQSQIKHSTLGNETNPTTPISIPTPKEKRRWSFRRSSAAASAPPKDCSPASAAAAEPAISAAPPPPPASLAQAALDAESEQHKKHAMAVAAATAAAADAAVAAAQAAAAVIRLTAVANGSKATAAEEAAAVKIQSVFRSYLARKALCALKGLVKLQALVRGHLVRKQATATLRCMQALVTAQARARAQRIRAADDAKPVATANQWTSTHRKSVQDNWLRNPFHDIDMGNLEENIKIVEMDIAATKGSATKSRNSYSLHPPPPPERTDHRLSTHHSAARPPSARASHDNNNHHNNHRIGNCQVSPAPSAALTDMSPRACSGHFEDYSFGTAQSSPQCYSAASKPDPAQIPFTFPRPDYAESLSYEFPLCPNYMANTESSRAKARSQSAPKSRPPDAFERQPSTRRRASIEGRNVPRAMRMQRSSSHVGAAAQNYQYPWSIKLDRSTVSLRDSECGSTSTVLTNTNYCRSLVGFDIHGNRY